MTTPFTYDFGYSWSITWGLLIPVVLFGAVAAAGLRLRWRRWVVIASALVVRLGRRRDFSSPTPFSESICQWRRRPIVLLRLVPAGLSTSGQVPDGRLSACCSRGRASTSPPSTSTRGIRHRRQQTGAFDAKREHRRCRRQSVGCRWRRASVAARDRSLRRRHQCGGYRPSSPRWNSQSARGSCTRPQAPRRISAGRRERRLVGAGGVTACARASSEQRIRAGGDPCSSPRGSISSNRERSRPCCIFCAASRNAEM